MEQGVYKPDLKNGVPGVYKPSPISENHHFFLGEDFNTFGIKLGMKYLSNGAGSSAINWIPHQLLSLQTWLHIL